VRVTPGILPSAILASFAVQNRSRRFCQAHSFFCLFSDALSGFEKISVNIKKRRWALPTLQRQISGFWQRHTRLTLVFPTAILI
jgi:hypothetical protein